MEGEIRPELAQLRERLQRTQDEQRAEARDKRHAKGYRTARENVADRWGALPDRGEAVA